MCLTTGTPIPEADVPNLWNKFYKVDKARTREYGGSGIGLSIVKAIMESMNQEYGVQNFDNGVEFWFTLDRNNKLYRDNVEKWAAAEKVLQPPVFALY